MWLAFYNQVGIGDVLLLTSGSVSNRAIIVETKENVTAIRDEATNQIVSINLFDVSKLLHLQGNGVIQLNEQQLVKINELIQSVGFDVEISVDYSPKFVVGLVEACRPHEDSDHLSVTSIRVNEDKLLQIVCGARNIAKGLKVMVALPGAVMPSGLIIWPGELRGEISNGMVCSTRELELTHIEDLPGIWELDKNLAIGMPLAEVVKYYA